MNDLTMAEYEQFYDYQDCKNGHTLHNYFMSQFNSEIENRSKSDFDNFKYGNEESYNINWNQNVNSNISEESIKDVLLDLDNIEFQNVGATDGLKNEYTSIDDEYLLEELCKEDTDNVLPDILDENYLSKLSPDKNLPSMETAFSKYCNYDTNKLGNSTVIENIEHYSYPNNLLYNMDKNYEPDTPTSLEEFDFERPERNVSVSESIDTVDSDFNESYNYEGETLDDDDLFINLDDFGIRFDVENDVESTHINKQAKTEKKFEKEKHYAERICQWEGCYERFTTQNFLVEHIERIHVNSFKGDEFSCFWKECARGRRPFNARYKLLIHMRVHSGHKPNRCHHPGCGKAFSRLENLKIHVRSHTGERPYACPAPHCRKAFSNSSDRAKHQRTHFNARPYACGAVGCGKRYTDPSSLRKHVKSHPHVANVPRTCIPPIKTFKRDQEQMVPTSPAKLTTLRSIRDKLSIPKLQRF